MHFRGTVKNLAAALALAAAVTGCGGGSSSTIQPPAVQTVKWQLDGSGSIQYKTNDPQYYSTGWGYTITPSYQAPMTTVTASVDKISGAPGSGAGIVFGFQDPDNFYRVMVDPYGHYLVSSKVAGTYTALIPWTSPHTAVIYSGYGLNNVISVTQNTLHNFSISFNGTQETQFTDSNFTAGYAGFFVSVGSSSLESFPTNPDDVRFKMSSPVVYPASVSGVQALQQTAAPAAIESFEFGLQGDDIAQ